MDTEAIEKNRILANMDIDAALPWMPGTTREVRLVALHKARYECVDIAPEMRHESGEWLRARGYGRTYGRPLLPEGDLPS